MMAVTMKKPMNMSISLTFDVVSWMYFVREPSRKVSIELKMKLIIEFVYGNGRMNGYREDENTRGSKFKRKRY